tara:strand:- start:3189 stop:4343 length:1155 start_codon:yes stop_codon:yes gene_type:complete
MNKFLFIISFLLIFFSCDSKVNDGSKLEKSFEIGELDKLLEGINLPEGFTIEIYADNISNARSMDISPSGTIFIGNRHGDNVFAIRDEDEDNIAEKKWLITNKLKNMPNGVAFHKGDLYVAEVDKLWVFKNIEDNLENPGDPILIYDDYPKDKHHGWKYIAFGPDGKLYVPVGAPCNICESKNKMYASITRMNPDGSDREIFAYGVRNTVGFTWNPNNDEMWFTDNGRDMLGDNIPPCELNRVTKPGQNFGYPYCHGDDIGDPEFGGKHPCSDFVPPARNLGPHVAPLGLKFYNGNMFPNEYKGDIFIAEHGSWNRSKKIGYRITRVKIKENKAISYEPFIYGWLNNEEQEAWGRPVDILILDDGSMLISDDKADLIYRVSYKG